MDNIGSETFKIEIDFFFIFINSLQRDNDLVTTNLYIVSATC